MQNRKMLLSWLIAGIILIIFSISTLIHAFTNNTCQTGPAMCSGKRIGAYIGIFLSIYSIIMAFYYFLSDNKPQITPQNNNKHHGLIVFGSLLIVVSIIMITIGLSSKALNNPPGALTTGFAMVISAIPIALSGGALTCFGIYNIKKQKTNKESHPVTTSNFIVGIVAMLFFIFF